MTGEVIPKAWLGRQMTVEQAERESLANIRQARRAWQVDIPEVPFGFENKSWREFLAQLQPGDELREFASPPETWAKGEGRMGFVAYRLGALVASLISKTPAEGN